MFYERCSVVAVVSVSAKLGLVHVCLVDNTWSMKSEK